MIAARNLPTPSHASALLFLAILAAVYAASLTIVRRFPSLAHPDAVAVGMTLDLLVVVPAAYWALLVRRTRVPVVTLVPVCVLSLVAAAAILPADRQAPIRFARALAIPLEIGLVGWIAWRAAGAWRRAGRDADADPMDRLRSAAFDVLRNERAAAIFACETAVAYYGVLSWFRGRPHVPAGRRAVAHHRRSGRGSVLVVLLVLFAGEGFAMHVLVARWSPLVAWTITIFTAYAALWLVADYRATVLRPILVGADDVVVRAGLRCTARVPRALIERCGPEKPGTGRDVANLEGLSAPTRWITVREPVVAEGPYGLRRRVRAFGVTPDVPDEEFDREIL